MEHFETVFYNSPILWRWKLCREDSVCSTWLLFHSMLRATELFAWNTMSRYVQGLLLWLSRNHHQILQLSAAHLASETRWSVFNYTAFQIVLAKRFDRFTWLAFTSYNFLTSKPRSRGRSEQEQARSSSRGQPSSRIVPATWPNYSSGSSSSQPTTTCCNAFKKASKTLLETELTYTFNHSYR